MAEATLQPTSSQPEARGGPLASIGRAWGRISPSLVPILAVLTALLFTIPFMIITGGRGDIGRGLQIAGTAYSALLEGSVGLAINDIVSPDDFTEVLALAAFVEQNGDVLDRSALRALARGMGTVAAMGPERARTFTSALVNLDDLDDDAVTTLGESIGDMRAIGEATLAEFAPAVAVLAELERSTVSDLAEPFAVPDAVSADAIAAVREAAPTLESLDDAALTRLMALLESYGIVRLSRFEERANTLRQAGIALDSAEADALLDLTTLSNGAQEARQAAEAITLADQAGITALLSLAEQVEILRAMYADDLLTSDNVVDAVNNELIAATQDNLIVRRPGNRIIVAPGNQPFGIVYSDVAPAASETSTDDAAAEASVASPKPSVVFLRLGSSALLFFPANLENMLVRATPFIIAGLAVALAFKGGMFNIGAEGQLYLGGILAITVAIQPGLANLPWFVSVTLVIGAGLLGGLFWGAVPGALKAYTGAHEVITTIMLNYIAVLLIDWLIKSRDPLILLDVNASTPRTPYIVDSAVLPRMDSIPPWLFVVAGILAAGLLLYRRRDVLRQNWRAAVRPITIGVSVAVIGLFLYWVSVGGALHIGFLIMLFTIWLVDWYLNRTTLGFELQTVGINSDAARYSGMNVRRNMILVMALSGALAGLAGTIEIAGVQRMMQPAFFAGIGFDAIAVALLARTNPRNMIWAGLLWGILLSGAGLMQVRANISIDLVKIIQALIIMFIAADAIIRWLWRVPKTSGRPAIIGGFKGWGG
jgi:simple sugar transport system permease protein